MTRSLALTLALTALAACAAPDDPDITETAAAPLAPPPLVIGAERDADVAVAGMVGRNTTAPAVAFDGTNYLVVWADQRDTTDSADFDIWCARVSQAGAVLDAHGVGVTSAPGPQVRPTVAFDGTRYVVAWENDKAIGGMDPDIAVALVSTGGVVTALPAVATTTAPETQPALAGNGSSALLVWSASNQIMAARWSGTAFGAPFAVTSTANAHQDPAVAAAPGGAYLVAFTETLPTTNADLRGQLITAAGALQGAAFDISVGPGAQTAAAASYDGANYDVVWANNRNGQFIYGARVSPAGAVLDTHVDGTATVGGVVVDNAGLTETAPALACTAAGCLAAWQDRRNGATPDVFARALPTTFAAGADFALATAPLAQAAPHVAAAAGGAFFAVWQDARSGTITVAGARVSGGATLDAGGVPIAPGWNQETAPAAARATTAVAVGWSDSRGAWGDDLETVRFDANGAALDATARAVSAAANRQSTAAAAGFGSTILYVWTDTRNGTDQDVYAARVTAATGALLDAQGIAVGTGAGDQFAPAVASSGTEALVVWQGAGGTGYDIYGSVIDASGTAGAPFAISAAAGDQLTPTVAYSAAAGQYVVAWIDARGGAAVRDLYAARVTAAGSVLDAAGVLVSTGAGGRFNPRIAAGASGALLLAFEDQRNGNRDIYGARVTAGAALTVLDAQGIALCVEGSKQQQPTVAASNGGWLVAWADPRGFSLRQNDILGQYVSSAGALVGVNFGISQNGEDETAPSAIDLSTIRVLVAYRKQRTDLHTGRVETRLVDATPTLLSIAVTPANPSVAKGLAQQFVATGTYSDGSMQVLTTTAVWSSATPAVATISNAAGTQGKAATLGIGTSVIHATVGTVVGSTVLTVTAPTLTGLAITPGSRTVPRHIPVQYAVTGTFTDGTMANLTTQVTWSTTNSAVATISNAAGSQGKATGVAAGTVTVHATLGSGQGSATLIISNATLSSISVAPTGGTVSIGAQFQQTATAHYSDGTAFDVTALSTWSSSRPTSMTISATGVAHAIATGLVAITARFDGVSGIDNWVVLP